jgi:hypothetical protein
MVSVGLRVQVLAIEVGRSQLNREVLTVAPISTSTTRCSGQPHKLRSTRGSLPCRPRMKQKDYCCRVGPCQLLSKFATLFDEPHSFAFWPILLTSSTKSSFAARGHRLDERMAMPRHNQSAQLAVVCLSTAEKRSSNHGLGLQSYYLSGAETCYKSVFSNLFRHLGLTQEIAAP